MREVCLNGAKPATERRKWARLPLAIPVFVRSRDEKGKEFLEFATALNVSAGGMLVAVRRSLPPVAQIRLEIPSAPLAAVARCPRPPATCVPKPYARRTPMAIICSASSSPVLWCLRPHPRDPPEESRFRAVKMFSHCSRRRVTFVIDPDVTGVLSSRLFGKLIRFNQIN